MIGGDGKLRDMIEHKLFKLGFVIVLNCIEENGDKLFVKFFVSDFYLIDEIV